MPLETRRHLLAWAAGLAVLAALWWALPDASLDPNGALNPHAVAEFLLIIVGISGLGRLCVHLLGHRYGLLLTGWVGGFASSTATIYAMGRLARQQPSVQHTTVSAAIVSSASTALQLMVLAQWLATPVAPLMRVPTALGLLVLIGIGAWTWRRASLPAPSPSAGIVGPALMDAKALLGLTALVCAISWASGWLFARFGSASLPVMAAISGLADAHALIPALGAFLRQGQLSPADAVVPVFVALTVNAASKSLIAFQSGGARFGWQVLTGLALSMAGVWAGVWLQASCG